MNRSRRFCFVSWLALVTMAATAEEDGQASTRTPMGAVVSNPELATLAGGKARPQQDVDLNVLVFFRPDKETSKETLKGLAPCEKRTVGKPVRWAAIVADRYPADQVKSAVAEAGILMPVLIDAGQALETEIAVAQLPAVAFTDKSKKLVAFQPFTRLNFCELVDARIRLLLKEITEAEFSALADPVSTKVGGDASEVAERDVKMAEMLLKAGANDKALESARLAVQRSPTLAAGHSILGECLRAAGNCKEAVAAFNKALALDPKDERASAGKKACAGKAP
jgi:tetratricopeptide (TPR) repeat protein